MLPASVEEADRPPATMNPRESPLLNSSSSEGHGLEEAGDNSGSSQNKAGPVDELPPAPSFSETRRLPFPEPDRQQALTTVADSTPRVEPDRFRERELYLGPACSFEVTLESRGPESPGAKRAFSLDPTYAEKHTPIAIVLVALSALYYVALGLLILFCISYTSTIFSGIFIAAGVLTGIAGIVALSRPSRSLLGVYVFVGLCLFVFMAVAWVLNVTLLIDYVKILNAAERNLQDQRASRNSGVPDESSPFVVDPRTTLASQGSGLSFPASAKNLGDQPTRLEPWSSNGKEGNGHILAEYRQQQGVPSVGGSQHSLSLSDRSVLEVQKPEESPTADRGTDYHAQKFSPSIVWKPEGSTSAPKEGWNRETKTTRVLRLSSPARINFTGESLILELEDFPDTQESAAVQEPAGSELGSDTATQQTFAVFGGRRPTLYDSPHSGNARSLSSVTAARSQIHPLEMPSPLLGPQLNKHPVVPGCVKGQQNDQEFLDKVGYTITAFAFEGLLCAYASYDLLSFHKWPRDCEKRCGFGLLETGKQYTRRDPASAAVFSSYMNHVARISAEDTTMCELYALSTGCTMVNRNYVMVVIILLSVWIALGVLGCCCLIPLALSRNYHIYRCYKRRSLQTMRRSLV